MVGAEARIEGGESPRQVRVTAWLDLLLAVLAVPFLVLLVIELAFAPGPPWAQPIAVAQFAIWGVFVAAFLFELSLASSKRRYLRTHWLVLLSLALPVLRVFRVFQALRILRGARLIRTLNLARILTRMNRFTGALRELLRVSQFVYLALLTAFVTLTAAAGVAYFERGEPESTLGGFGEALWWAVNVVTTGGEAAPVSVEARVLTLLLRVFGLSVFGYLTARIAVFFLRLDRPEPERQDELARLREEVARLADRLPPPDGAGATTRPRGAEEERSRR